MVRTTSSLIQKQEGEKQALWNRRLGKRVYIDNKFIRSKGHNKVEHMKMLLQKWTAESTTVYVGNLSFGHPEFGSTTEEQVFDLCGRCGDVKRVVMGLDRMTKTPCGFCFVEFHSRAAAEACVGYLNGTKLDGEAIRCEMDRGHIDSEPDRKFGRSKSGGQVRDDMLRQQGVVRLNRLSSRDAAEISPRLRGPLKTSSSAQPIAAQPMAALGDQPSKKRMKMSAEAPTFVPAAAAKPTYAAAAGGAVAAAAKPTYAAAAAGEVATENAA